VNTTKQEAIAHYERMIKWAKTQPPGNRIRYKHSVSIMFVAIGEDWYGKNCVYCQKYIKYSSSSTNKPCPLTSYVIPYCDDKSCCNGLWIKMNNSTTWKEWIINAEKVLEYIKENG